MSGLSYIGISDIDVLVSDFVEEYRDGISSIHRFHFPNHDTLALNAFIAEISDELKSGCISYINNHDSLDSLNSYLFYIVNVNAKKRTEYKPKKATEYLCPGCLFLGKTNLVVDNRGILSCDECNSSLQSSKDPKLIEFLNVFVHHSKKGYRCNNCERFIPHTNDEIIICPYLDCCFIGDAKDLKRMNHPSAQSNLEKLVADVSIVNAMASTVSPDDSLEAKTDLLNQLSVIKDVIGSLKNSVPYTSTDFTAMHKQQAYQAFMNLLEKHPEGMVDYLLFSSRSGGFQNKIFQEYIRLIEESIPFCFQKGKKVFRVESLLDDNLGLFNGISVFDAIVTDKCEVKNNTQEFYIGGRKASYVKPYYIGKLLNVIDSKQESLLDKVVEYNFSKVRLRDIKPGTTVTVTHLRVPPHYQMGGMVYINRARKKIVTKSLAVLENENQKC